LNKLTKKQRNKQIDVWIAQDELPSKAGLKPVRQFDELYNEDPIEQKAYWDFINWSLGVDHLDLQEIRKKRGSRFEKDFWELS